MFFLKQIQEQFFLQITMSVGPGGPEGQTEVEQAPSPVDAPEAWITMDEAASAARNATREAESDREEIDSGITKLAEAEWWTHPAERDSAPLEAWDGNDTLIWDEGDDTLDPNNTAPWAGETELQQARRAEVIAELTENWEFSEWMDGPEREALIQARLEQQAIEIESDLAVEDAMSLIEEEWFAELLFESEVEAEEFRQSIIDWLELDGTETPEEIEALIQEQFSTLRNERMAILNRQAEEIQRNLDNPNITPQRRQQFNRELNANNVARNIVSGWGVSGEYGNFNQWWIGISPDQNELYGDIWSEFAQFLEARWFRPYDASPNLCGKNCGEALNDFYRTSWRPELQINDRPRHGYRWAEICANRPDDFVKLNCTPQEAPAWAIISYNRWTWGSAARWEYGHVEIALGENTWYYYWANRPNPGWSNPNFTSDSYQIYMPKSQTA